MKKEQSIINKDDFFAGKLTNEQEKQLKNKDDNSFFEVLRDEKEIKMDLSFDDFMTKVEENQPKEIERSNTNQHFLWRISGIAASFFIVIGLFFFFNQSKEVDNLPAIVKTIEPNKTVEHAIDPIEVKEEIISVQPPIRKEVTQIQKITKTIKEKKSIIQPIEQEIIEPESAEEYSSDFVVVNGQPVENMEEAKALAYTTMKLFSKNVDQGAKAFGQLKSLSIEL